MSAFSFLTKSQNWQDVKLGEKEGKSHVEILIIEAKVFSPKNPQYILLTNINLFVNILIIKVLMETGLIYIVCRELEVW